MHSKCASCPARNRCPVAVRKDKADLMYTDRQMRVAVCRRETRAPRFIKTYAPGCLAEQAFGVLYRRFSFKKRRVRGLPAIGSSLRMVSSA
jgi:hypothetical protein